MLKTRRAMYAILVASLLSLSIGVVYAAGVLIQSNTVTVTPSAPPSITLAVDNPTPYVGATVTFTATIGSSVNGVLVTFKSGTTTLGSATTAGGGIATLTYLITSTTILSAIASATVG